MNIKLSTSFFEWGLKCIELETDSIQVPSVSPIASISFNWSTVQPQESATEYTRRTYGVGQCKFEMYQSSNKCNIQDVFKQQIVLPEIIFIRYINDAGKSIESEKYVFREVVICGYEFESKPDQIGQRDIVSIYSTGDHKYIQIVRENGKSIGQKVTRPYNIQQGVK